MLKKLSGRTIRGSFIRSSGACIEYAVATVIIIININNYNNNINNYMKRIFIKIVDNYIKLYIIFYNGFYQLN